LKQYELITGAVGLAMRESFLELGGFVAQLEYLILYRINRDSAGTLP